MSTYLNTIQVGVIFFALLFIFFLFLTYIIQYRRNGFFSIKEGIIFLAFIFYLEIAYFMVILPLPDLSTFPASTKPIIDYMQLNPFYFVQDIIKYFSNHLFTLSNILKAPPVYTTLFNIIMLYPLGVFLKNLFKLSHSKVVIIGFFISLSFELLQLSGLLFIYPHPYRLFDIDDLIMNTFGTFLGSISAFIYYPLFKKSKKTKENINHFKPTIFKQFFILLCDLFIINILSFVTIILINLITNTDNYNQLILIIITILYFGDAIRKTHYQTLAMKIMNFKLENSNDSIFKKILRTFLLYTSFLLVGLFDNNMINRTLYFINLLVIFYVFISLFKHKAQVNIIDRKLGYTLTWNSNKNISLDERN